MKPINLQMLINILKTISFMALIPTCLGQIRARNISCEKPRVLIRDAYRPIIYGDKLLGKRRNQAPNMDDHFVYDLTQRTMLPQLYPQPSANSFYFREDAFPFGVLMRKEYLNTTTISTYTFRNQGWQEDILYYNDQMSEFVLGPTLYIDKEPMNNPLGQSQPHYFKKSYLGIVVPSYFTTTTFTLPVSDYDFKYCSLDASPFATEGCYRTGLETFNITDPIAQTYRLWGEPRVTSMESDSVGFLWTGVRYNPYPFISELKHFRTIVKPNGEQDTMTLYDTYNESGRIYDHFQGLLALRTETFSPGVAIGLIEPGDALLPMANFTTAPIGPSVRHIKLNRFFDRSAIFDSSNLMTAYSISSAGSASTNGQWKPGIYLSRAKSSNGMITPIPPTYVSNNNDVVTDPFLVSEVKTLQSGKKIRGSRLYFSSYVYSRSGYTPNIMSTFCY